VKCAMLEAVQDAIDDAIEQTDHQGFQPGDDCYDPEEEE